MYHRETFRAHQLLTLLAEDCGSDILALITHRIDVHLRCCVLSPVAIEMTLPEALHAEIVEAIITSKGRHIVPTFLAFVRAPLAHLVTFLRLYYLAVGCSN